MTVVVPEASSQALVDKLAALPGVASASIATEAGPADGPPGPPAAPKTKVVDGRSW